MKNLLVSISILCISNLAIAQIVLSHSGSNNILPLNAVSCLADDNTSLDNVYSRSFKIADDFGIRGNFKIDSIQLGIQEVQTLLVNEYPLYIRYSTTDLPYPTGASSLLQMDTVYVTDTILALLSFPTSVIVPDSSELIVEIGFFRDDANPITFYIGTNSSGETAPSYILSQDCNLPTPVTIASIGYPNSQLVLNLIGHECSTYDTITELACNSYTSPSGNYVWTESGAYTDVIPNASGCDSVITINLTINHLNTEIVQVDNYLVSTQSNAEYEWIDCNTLQPILTADRQIFIANETGDYQLHIQKDGCEFESTCFTITSVETGLQFKNMDVILSPNPTENFIHVQISNVNSSLTYELIDKNGVIVLTDKIENSDFLISLEQFGSGIYFLRISDGGNYNTYSIIKK